MNKSIKRIFASVLLSLIFLQSASAAFLDVFKQSVFYDSVEYFSKEIPIISTDREKFRPFDKVNRAEFFKLIISSGNYDPKNEFIDLPYSDIEGNEWFAPYIQRALNLQIVGYDDKDPYFKPAENITRIEGLLYIFTYYDINADMVSDFPKDYFDVSEKDYFANESQFAYMFRLFADYRSRYFNPHKELTRGDTIHILYKLHEAGFVATISEPTNYADMRESDSYKIFLDVYNTILRDYIDKDNIDQKELIYGAISGMVMSLSDPYSAFILPKDSQTFKESLSGTFDGIGVYLSYENENYIIQTPLKGSPADKAGLKPKDIITHIEGIGTFGMTFNDVINLLRGPSGTQVTLTIKRDSISKDYTLTREIIDFPFVEGEMINGVGVIHYYQFTSNSHYQFVNAINSIISKNPKGIVIDLRNNPGGYLYSAQQLISRFVPKNDPFVIVNLADGYSYKDVSYGPADLSKYKVVVLINEGSASASEIVALALREKLNAKIVGKNSFGKDKIQEIIYYEDGSSLKLSIAKWTSPDGVSVYKEGIVPDFEISDESAQLDKAISLVAH